MIDERELVERAVRALVREEPSFDDLIKRRDHKRRNRRIAAGVVGIAVFLAAIWIVRDVASLNDAKTKVTPAGSGATGPRESGPTESRASFVPSAHYVGLPPAKAKPSGPEEGRLLIEIHEIHVGWICVYADGRVISWSEGTLQAPEPYGYREQRLTPEGADLLRSELISTGLFDRNRDLRLTPELNHNHLRWGLALAREGDRLVRVTWGPRAGPSPNAIKTVPTPEQALALAGLVRPGDPASSLPARAWEDPTMRPYVPYRYAACTSTSLDGIPAAAQDLLRLNESTSKSGATCFDVTTEDARALDEILADAGFQNPIPAYGDYWPQSKSGDVLFRPILPHGTWVSQGG